MRTVLLFAAASSLLLLAGCGSSSYGVDSGSGPPTGNNGGSGGTPGNPLGGGGGPTGSDNTVVATPSIQGTVSVVAGGTRNVAIAFTSSDGRAISGFGISGSLSNLPAGWKGPTTFSCSQVSTGSGCVLNLTYSPAAAASGSITLDYVFVDNSTTPRTTGSLTIPYVATPQNNVVATAAPAGQVAALVGGGAQPVTVTFTTDDGTPATNLTLTTNLTALPVGWSAAGPTFACASVSTGSGCELDLQFAPTVPGVGTLSLAYAYTNDGGIAKNGTLNIAYAATTNDNVVGAVSPGGQVNAVLGAGSQSVTVTFTTDDGRPATAFALTVNPATTPTGWSSTQPTLNCAVVSTGTGCQLPLTYAPSAIDSGTWTLAYSYVDNSGNAKTGSVDVVYRATSSDNVVGTASASSLGVLIGSSTPVTVTFTTDDGNPATSLNLTTDLTALPTGWSSASSSFTCASVSTGTGCQLSLTYAPSAADSGALSLAYGYLDDSGAAKTGTVSIPYAATPPPHLYLAQLGVGGNTSPGVYICSLNSDGTLGTCAATASGVDSTTGIVFYGGNHAYVSDYSDDLVYLCNVAPDGTLSGCASTGSNFNYPFQLAISGTTLYATDALNTAGVTTCTIQPDATLANCSASGGTGYSGVAANSSYVYLGVDVSTVDVCQIGSAGALQSCASTGSGFAAPLGITLSGGHAYVANGNSSSVSVCTVSLVDGTLSNCATSAAGGQPSSVAFNGGQAYVNDLNGNVYLCAVDATDGSLSGCAATASSLSFSLVVQIAIH